MKTKILFLPILLLSLLAGCDKHDEEIPSLHKGNDTEEAPGTNAELPEGYFEVSFLPSAADAQTRVAVSGPDARVQHIHYVIYKSTGEFVKEKVILQPVQGVPTWPFPAVRDTLPKGSYQVVFMGNVEKTLFPYATSGSSQNYAEVLTNYKTTYADGRITLPPAEFSNNTEYYWATASFSDASPNPSILLQRIIGQLRLHRQFVDTNDAVNALINNIRTQIDYKNIIKTTLTGSTPQYPDGMLYSLLRGAIVNDLGVLLSGLLDPLLNDLVLKLADPIVDALYTQLINSLANQLDAALRANAASNETGLAYLGRILNPWAYGNDAIVTIDNFPKSIDFNLNITDRFPVGQKFHYGLKVDAGGTLNERYVSIKGFNGNYDVKKIDILSQGLVAGLVVDQVIDSNLLLPGVFMDITDPITSTDPKYNWRYKAEYDFLDLALKSYTPQTDGFHSLSLTVQIDSIANIDGVIRNSITGIILNGLTLGLLDTLVSHIMNVYVTVPVNLPLLGIDNLKLSGGWSPISNY